MLTASDVAHFAPLRLFDGEHNSECQAYMTLSLSRDAALSVSNYLIGQSPQTFVHVVNF